jgi:hypothetical protein
MISGAEEAAHKRELGAHVVPSLWVLATRVRGGTGNGMGPAGTLSAS